MNLWWFLLDRHPVRASVYLPRALPCIRPGWLRPLPEPLAKYVAPFIYPRRVGFYRLVANSACDFITDDNINEEIVSKHVKSFSKHYA